MQGPRAGPGAFIIDSCDVSLACPALRTAGKGPRAQGPGEGEGAGAFIIESCDM